jgi:hypothetical protein
LLNKREEQLSENTDAVGPAFWRSPKYLSGGEAAFVSAASDDPVVTQAAVEQLRRERLFWLSHIFKGGDGALEVVRMFIEHYPSGGFDNTSSPPWGSYIPESSINITFSHFAGV